MAAGLAAGLAVAMLATPQRVAHSQDSANPYAQVRLQSTLPTTSPAVGLEEPPAGMLSFEVSEAVEEAVAPPSRSELYSMSAGPISRAGVAQSFVEQIGTDGSKR